MEFAATLSLEERVDLVIKRYETAMNNFDMEPKDVSIYFLELLLMLFNII